ncbi:MAG: YggT family protein [Spirochaetales bacterium]|nr:YggT family protein [Spirochaetales bacterium]
MNNIFQTTMTVLSGILSVFSLMLFIRILLSWFHAPFLDGPKQFLGAIVDPYLNKFRGIEWLRFGMLDFSPVLAFILLGLAINITTNLSHGQAVTIGRILAYLISDIWGFASFFMNIMIVMLIVFLVANLMGRNIMLGGLNNLLYRITDRVMSLFGRETYHMTQGIIISLVFILVLRVGLSIGFAYLINFLYRL